MRDVCRLAFALHRLHGDAATVGYLYAAPYAGAFVGSLVSGWTSHVRRIGVASAPNLGDPEAGVLAPLTSLRFSIVSGGVLCVVGCAVTALALPGFLRYDARPDG